MNTNTRRQAFFLVLAVCFLLATLYYIWYQTKPDLDKKLYNTYFSAHPNNYMQVQDQVYTDTLYQAFWYYESTSYAQAIELFKKLKDSDTNEDIQFYMANTHMGQENMEEAEDNLRQILRSDKYGDAARWYLALIKLKNHNHIESKLLLRQIIDHKLADEYWIVKSKSLLSELSH